MKLQTSRSLSATTEKNSKVEQETEELDVRDRETQTLFDSNICS